MPTQTARSAPVDAPGRQAVTGLSKAQAEALLDWLEGHRCGNLEATWEEGEGITVRFEAPRA